MLDHIIIVWISDSSPTIWTLAVVAVTTAFVMFVCSRGRDDDR
jgi:hypothetical protein